MTTSPIITITSKDIVSQYVGWTSQWTNDALQKALGGTLIIKNSKCLRDKNNSYHSLAVGNLHQYASDNYEECHKTIAAFICRNLGNINVVFQD